TADLRSPAASTEKSPRVGRHCLRVFRIERVLRTDADAAFCADAVIQIGQALDTLTLGTGQLLGPTVNPFIRPGLQPTMGFFQPLASGISRRRRLGRPSGWHRADLRLGFGQYPLDLLHD